MTSVMVSHDTTNTRHDDTPTTFHGIVC